MTSGVPTGRTTGGNDPNPSSELLGYYPASLRDERSPIPCRPTEATTQCSVAFSPDGKKIVVGDAAGHLTVFER